MPDPGTETLIEIVGEAMRLPPTERESFIRGACPEPGTQREATSLIRALVSAGGFLETPTVASTGRARGVVIERPGDTETGRPYFVMELVRGQPITAYCAGDALTTRDRLELFVQVCLAVQHAHTKGIIHRDLKPANILVSEVDGRALPRVIDFGIAK